MGWQRKQPEHPNLTQARKEIPEALRSKNMRLRLVGEHAVVWLDHSRTPKALWMPSTGWRTIYKPPRKRNTAYPYGWFNKDAS